MVTNAGVVYRDDASVNAVFHSWKGGERRCRFEGVMSQMQILQSWWGVKTLEEVKAVVHDGGWRRFLDFLGNSVTFCFGQFKITTKFTNYFIAT